MFALNPPNVPELSLTTTGLSAKQTIDFAQAVGVEVTQVTSRLLECLLTRSRAVGTFSLCGPSGRYIFPSAVGFDVADSIAFQSHYLFLTNTGLSVTFGTGAVSDFRHLSVNEPSCSLGVAARETSDPEDVPFAASAHQEKLRKI